LIDQAVSWIHASNHQDVLCEVLIQEVDLRFSRRFDQEEKEVKIRNPLKFDLIGDQAQNQVVPGQSSRSAIPQTLSPIGEKEVQSIT